jgi:hypothetical protein
MKNIKTFNEFVNEATKVDNTKDLEKQLPKEFGVLDYLKAYKNYSAQFSSRLTLYDEIRRLAPEIPLEKLVMSKGAWWNYQKERTEQGYGGIYRTKAEGDSAYDEFLEESPERLFNDLIHKIGKDKALKKFANLIIKSAGKLEAAKRVMYQSYANADDGYDRHLIMDRFFKSRMRELWHDSDDVYYIKGVGSITTAMRTVRGSDLKSYINNIGKDMVDVYRKKVGY